MKEPARKLEQCELPSRMANLGNKILVLSGKAGGGERLATEMGVPFLGRIPLDPRIVMSGDSGTPFIEFSTESQASRAFAAALEPILCQSGRPPLPASHQHNETHIMKIAIPVANGTLCTHFGHCEQFALVEVAADSHAVANITFLAPPAHEPGVLPRWLHEKGANVIIAGGMGQRARGLFSQHGIKVVVGAPTGSPAEVVSAYLENTLEVGQNTCDH